MNAFDDFIDTILSAAETPPAWAVGVVKTVTPNGSDPPLVTVTWKGADVPARCPRHYTPVVGHLVLMGRFGPQLLIVGAY